MKKSVDPFQEKHETIVVRVKPPKSATLPKPPPKTHHLIARCTDSPPDDSIHEIENGISQTLNTSEPGNKEVEKGYKKTPLSTKNILERALVYTAAPLLLAYGLAIDPYIALEALLLLYDFAKSLRKP